MVIYKNKIILQNELIDKYLKSFCGWGDFPVNMCGKLYKMELIKDVPVTKLVYGEDLCFNLYVLPKAKKIVSIPDNIYFYVYGGITTNLDEERMFEDAIKQYNYKVCEFTKYGQFSLIEMANVELCNYFISYVDNVIDNYSLDIAKQKALNKIKNPILQKASKSFGWFNNDKKYIAIKTQDIELLFSIRIKLSFRRKYKKKILSMLQKVLVL